MNLGGRRSGAGSSPHHETKLDAPQWHEDGRQQAVDHHAGEDVRLQHQHERGEDGHGAHSQPGPAEPRGYSSSITAAPNSRRGSPTA